MSVFNFRDLLETSTETIGGAKHSRIGDCVDVFVKETINRNVGHIKTDMYHIQNGESFPTISCLQKFFSSGKESPT